MTNIDAQRIKEIRDNTKEMTYYMKSIAKSFERIADALIALADRKTEPQHLRDGDFSVPSKGERRER